MDERTTEDPRRQSPIVIKWRGMIGELILDGESWGAIEWSEQKQAWCIEDAEGQCLRHKDHIRGQAAAKDAAIELAQEMIRDGRMPSPEEARRFRKEQLKQQRERRSKQPSEIRRRAEREERDRLWKASYEAEYLEEDATPFHEVIADTFDLTDPNLWRSNSFAALRARLIISIKRTIAKCEYQISLHHWRHEEHARRIDRAREILRLLHD
jgi:polyhydroxyalkanoate synthesis regulator phasin